MSGSHLMPETEEQLEEKAEELSHDEQLGELSKNMELLYRLFKQTAPSLAARKKNSLVRVLEALIFGEFEEIELKGKEEKKLLDICLNVVQTKGTMYNMMVQKQLEKEEENNG